MGCGSSSTAKEGPNVDLDRTMTEVVFGDGPPQNNNSFSTGPNSASLSHSNNNHSVLRVSGRDDNTTPSVNVSQPSDSPAPSSLTPRAASSTQGGGDEFNQSLFSAFGTSAHNVSVASHGASSNASGSADSALGSNAMRNERMRMPHQAPQKSKYGLMRSWLIGLADTPKQHPSMAYHPRRPLEGGRSSVLANTTITSEALASLPCMSEDTLAWVYQQQRQPSVPHVDTSDQRKVSGS